MPDLVNTEKAERWWIQRRKDWLAEHGRRVSDNLVYELPEQPPHKDLEYIEVIPASSVAELEAEVERLKGTLQRCSDYFIGDMSLSAQSIRAIASSALHPEPTEENE